MGEIEKFMAEDHARLDRLLVASEPSDGAIDEPTYARFRQGLLRHIGMEEKILLPYARVRRGGKPLEFAAILRRDHGAIARLLVRSPNPALLAALREILGRHNVLEEGPSGVYAACDELAVGEVGAVVARLREHPDVPLAPYYDGPPHGAR